MKIKNMHNLKMICNDCGLQIIEACLIMPLIIMIVFSMLAALLFTYEKEVLRENAYGVLYSVPFENVKSKTETDYIKSKEFSENMVYGKCECKVENEENENVKISQKLSVIRKSNIECDRRICLVSGNLRRWQFYGDTAGK